MPMISVRRHYTSPGWHNHSMASPPVLAPPEWDPSFHGSVHTATLAVCTVLVIFVVILGTFGNGMVLLSALQCQCRKLRSNFDVLVFNLAGADFIICLCLSPTFLYLLFSDPPSPREFCGGFLFSSTTCGLLSLLTLVAIAAHRQSRVRGRVKSSLSTAKTAVILGAIYLVAIGTAVGGTLHVTLSWTNSYTTCQAIMNSSDITRNNVILFFISPIIFISFIVIVVSYGVIARAVRVQTYLRVKALQPLLRPPIARTPQYKPIQTSVISDKSATAPDMQQVLIEIPAASPAPKKPEPLKHCSCCSCMAALDKENKAVTMCFVVILIIALCWTPLVISHVIELLTGESIILYQVKLCGIALVFLNSALDPYMYAQNNGRIKQRYGRFFWDMLRCGCRMPRRQQFRTLTPKSTGARTLRNPAVTQDCATLQFLQHKNRKTIFKNCENANLNANKTKDKFNAPPKATYTNNILIYGGGAKLVAPQGPLRKVEVRDTKKTLTQNGGVMSDVRILVHKSCCHAHSPDDQSLIES
ncbi:LOW QUALITY PROTEIN: probable G-protein coupled receptor 75 [Physella acuta]|uniref:LOW QUALITY PROTEIN: probable G-protein coupled receptor 75 n=1 Tax=Physella acuta TaxID=109671 RepID=UPI0027DD84AF|nr:LOW QUALITY PROTEIN: probable G-protein coupled receptor 75 [Physella acuta]